MKQVKNGLARTAVGLYLLFFLAVSLLPFYLMIVTSLKGLQDYSKNGYFRPPQIWMFSNYSKVIADGFLSHFKNSLVITAVSLLLLLFCGLCASYVFARFRLKWTALVFSFVIACMSISIHVALIPIYLLTRQIGLYDTIWALVGPYVAFNLPITVFILTSFMREIPQELEESARIDGAGYFRLFLNILVPLCRPGIVTVSIYDAIAMWNEFGFALVLTQSPETRTLPLAVWNYKGQYGANIPMVFSVLFLSVIPMIIAYAVGQDKLVKGMMAGAVKG